MDVNEFRSIAEYADADSDIGCSRGHATLTSWLRKYFSIGNKNVFSETDVFTSTLNSNHYHAAK